MERVRRLICRIFGHERRLAIFNPDEMVVWCYRCEQVLESVEIHDG